MSDDELKQLKAYKVGYDLGWYRALESTANDLQEIADGILNSATIRAIEQEGGERPIFLAKVLNIIGSINEMRQENLPTLLIERKAITDLGGGLMKVLTEAPELLESKKDVLTKLEAEL